MNNLPLVSILIPAYNRPHFLEIALQSALEQTYPSIEIIICDDSTTDEVQEMIAPYVAKYPHLHYHRNPKKLDINNWHRCFSLSSGQYISYLHDDDVIHPEKIQKMMAYYLQNEADVTLVTSYRQPIDELGNFLHENGKISAETTIMDGKQMGDLVLTRCANMIGEPSCVLFRKADLKENFGIYKGRQYFYLNDLATWISLLSKGKGVYISEALTYFRCHSGQNQNQPKVLASGVDDWIHLLRASRKDGFLNNHRDYYTALRHFRDHICLPVIRKLKAAKQKQLLERYKVHSTLSYVNAKLKKRKKRSGISKRKASAAKKKRAAASGKKRPSKEKTKTITKRKTKTKKKRTTTAKARKKHVKKKKKK